MTRILRSIVAETLRWRDAFYTACPGQIGTRLRRCHFRHLGGKGGANIQIDPGIRVQGWANIQAGQDVKLNSGCVIEAVGGRLSIGNRCSFNYNVIVVANQGAIVLGDNVIIGMGTVIRAANHTTALVPDVPIRDQPHTLGEVIIEDDVWIGANVTILPNVRIGAHSVVAAGAVVNRDMPPFSMIAGVPARRIGAIGGDINNSEALDK